MFFLATTRFKTQKIKSRVGTALRIPVSNLAKKEPKRPRRLMAFSDEFVDIS